MGVRYAGWPDGPPGRGSEPVYWECAAFLKLCRIAPPPTSGAPSLIKAISREEVHVVTRPAGTNAFEFVVVSALRAAQLMRGCTPRVPAGYKHIVTAQLEVAAGKVAKIVDPPKP